MDSPSNGSDGPSAFPPIDITVRLWMGPGEQIEVISPIADWLTTDALTRASEQQAELEEAKHEAAMEADISEGDEG